MIFTSLTFIIFSCIFFSFYPFIKKFRQLRYAYIVIASFIFYGWWDWRYLLLIIFTGSIDFFVALLIERYRHLKKIFLATSLCCNLSILFSFKYLIWFLNSLFSVSDGIVPFLPAAETFLPEFFHVLPVGISFYTFQSMSYTIDVYREGLRPTKNIFQYFSYLSMFPQLVAGPIVRARDVLEQLERPEPLTGERFYDGLSRIGTGFFKKTVIADTLAPFVNQAFSGDVAAQGATHWWLIVLAFAIQIYCDFSGYSDIAIGLARWMGIDFKDNFNFPYHATSPSDFWKRWHISLSSWFRDYVYIPLGGSRAKPPRVLLNLWITMLLSGFWHGASWHFVVWGGFHALLLSLQRLLARYPFPIPNGAKIALTFLGVLVGWIFFRSQTISQACDIISLLLTPSAYAWQPLVWGKTLLRVTVYAFFLFNFLMLLPKFRILKERYHPYILAILVAVSLFYRGDGDAFIYFQF